MRMFHLDGAVAGALLMAVTLCPIWVGSAGGFTPPERTSYAAALQKVAAHPCLSPEEVQLVTLINLYRGRKGLPAVAISPSLVQTARVHVQDLQDNYLPNARDRRGLHCNLHSWSSRGSWKPVCYTSDHAYADLMRSKPREITARAYDEVGYEVAYYSSSEATPGKAMEAWSNSQRHRDLIFEMAKWGGAHLKAVGAAVSDNYAVAWFGETPDPLGPLPACTIETKETLPPRGAGEPEIHPPGGELWQRLPRVPGRAPL